MAQRAVTPRWHVLDGAEGVRDAALERIRSAAAEAIAARGAFHLALAGGTTPQKVYEALRGMPAQWDKWHVWFGDERCLPTDHPERNSRMARGAWLDHVAISPAQVHDIPAELGAEAGAAAYAEALREVAEFDLVLLGLGEDGHTASLFPGHEWGDRPGFPDVLVVHGAPKPPPDRISLSAKRLGRARQVLFLVSGGSKSEAVTRWRKGEGIPAAAIVPPAGVDVLVDDAAFAAY
jgi:6-phosphogluconolactonase